MATPTRRGFRLTFLMILAAVAIGPSTVAQRFSPQARAGDEAMKQKDYTRALAAYQAALAEGNGDSHAIYNSACAAARLGQTDLAFAYLDRVFPAGEEWVSDFKRIEKDADLATLRADQRWAELISTLAERYAAVQTGPYAALKHELLTLHEADQGLRKKISEIEKKHGQRSPEMDALWKQINAADAANLPKVEAILAQHGWLGSKQVGPIANGTLFLVIQHADLATQQKYLPMMRAAVKAGNAAGGSLALLEDRIALREGRLQTYGSQVFGGPDGIYYVAPLEDPDNVDARRAAVGLGPMADYVRRWNITWDLAAYKAQLPTLKSPYTKQ